MPIVRHYPLKTLRVYLVPLWAAQLHTPIVRRVHPNAWVCYMLRASAVAVLHIKQEHYWYVTQLALDGTKGKTTNKLLLQRKKHEHRWECSHNAARGDKIP